MKYTRELIESLYEGCEGNFSKMSKAINVPTGSIRTACKRYGLENKRIPGRKIYTPPKSPAYIRTVQLLPTMNNSMISREVNLSKERIRQIRDEHGISSPFKHKFCNPYWTEEKLAILYKLDISKYHQKEIAKMVGVSQPVLSTKCKEIGIDLSVCLNAGREKGLKLYPTEMLLELYKKHNGNIMHIAQEYVDNGTYKNINAATAAFHRRYKKLGLKGQGEQFVMGHSRGKTVKYTYEVIKPLWDKYEGNLSAIARDLNVNQGCIWRACVRLDLHTPLPKVSK